MSIEVERIESWRKLPQENPSSKPNTTDSTSDLVMSMNGSLKDMEIPKDKPEMGVEPSKKRKLWRY